MLYSAIKVRKNLIPDRITMLYCSIMINKLKKEQPNKMRVNKFSGNFKRKTSFAS